MGKKKEFTEYLKYALGEIVLTIVGIILALQVHVWNEKRIEKKEVDTITSNLSSEFKLNLASLDNTISLVQTSIENSNKVLDLIGQNESQLKQKNIDSLLSLSFRYEKFNPSQDVIFVLINSNKLKLIKNKKMRKALYEWSSSVSNFNDSFEDLDENTGKFFDYLIYNYPIKDLDYYSGKTKKQRTQLKTNKYKVFSDLVFENQLDNHNYYLISYLKSLEETKDIITLLIEESVR